MNPIVSELFKAFVKELAHAVAEQLKTPAPGAADIGKAETAEPVFKADVTADRSEGEWRADCLAIINDIAPTHGPQLRKLFAAFGAKRLPELDAEKLPAFLAELVSLRDAN